MLFQLLRKLQHLPPKSKVFLLSTFASVVSALSIPVVMTFQTAQLLNYFSTPFNNNLLNIEVDLPELGTWPKTSIILLSVLSTILLFILGHFIFLLKPKRKVFRLMNAWLSLFMINSLPVGILLGSLYSDTLGYSNKWLINEPGIVFIIAALFFTTVILCRDFWFNLFYEALMIDIQDKPYMNKDVPILDGVILPWITGLIFLSILTYYLQAWFWFLYLSAMSIIVFSLLSRQQISSLLLSLFRIILQNDKSKYYKIYQRFHLKKKTNRDVSYPDTTFDFYDKLSDFVLIKRQKRDFQVYYSNISILFGQIPFGTNVKELSGAYKKPKYINFELFNNEVLLAHIYKDKFLTRQSRKSLVFFNNEFFFGDVTVNKEAVFQKDSKNPILTNREVKCKMIQDISKLYQIELPAKEDQFIIVDGSGTTLWFCDTGFAYQIRYFSSKNHKIGERLFHYFTNHNNVAEVLSQENFNHIWNKEAKPQLYLSNN